MCTELVCNTKDMIVFQLQIARTNAMIAQEERALVDHPEYKEALVQSIASLNKVRGQLEAQDDTDRRNPP